jgi:hypothetical protein
MLYQRIRQPHSAIIAVEGEYDIQTKEELILSGCTYEGSNFAPVTPHSKSNKGMDTRLSRRQCHCVTAVCNYK